MKPRRLLLITLAMLGLVAIALAATFADIPEPDRDLRLGAQSQPAPDDATKAAPASHGAASASSSSAP